MAFVLLLLASLAAAQSSVPAIELAPGTTLAVRLEHSVRAKRARPGDPVRATLLAPLLSHGIVVVPHGARITGHVLSAEARKGASPSRLMIRFERADWHDSSAVMNANLVRQLRVRQTVVYGGNRSPCSSFLHFQFQRRGADPPTVLPPRGSYSPCDERIGVTPQSGSERIVFVSPPLKDMRLQRALAPPGATELVSSKKNVSLEGGTILEIRNAGP